jgi:hypothetical protein
VPEKGHHEDCGGEEVGCFEEFVAESSLIGLGIHALRLDHGIVLCDANVNQAWKIRATMPVQ